MKTNYIAAILFIGFISFFSCTRTTSISNNTTESARTRADSVVYMLTVDSISLPIRLSEIGDFPVYSMDAPYLFTISGNFGNYKDPKYLHFVNGQRIEGRQRDRILHKLKQEDVESIKFVPAEQGMEDYGQKAAHGIIYIETRNKK
jgi:hypothetical protein